MKKGNPSILLDFLIYGTSVALILLLSWSSFRGLDLTDESFYLIGLKNPFEFKYNITFFHLIIKRFFGIFTYDITINRLIRLLITLILSFILVRRVNNLYQITEIRYFGLGFVLCGMLFSYSIAPQTLSYNIISQIAAVLSLTVLTSQIYISKTSKKRRNWNLVLFGFLTMIILLNKFSNALPFVFFLFCLQIYQYFKKEIKLKDLLISLGMVVSGIILCLIFLFESSFKQVSISFQSFVLSLSNVPAENSMSTLFLKYNNDLCDTTTQIFKDYYDTFLFFFVSAIIAPRSRHLIGSIYLTACILLISTTIGLHYNIGGLKGVYTLNYFIFAMLFLSFLLYIVYIIKFRTLVFDSVQLFLLLFALSLPLALSIGTDNRLSVQVTYYTVFYFAVIYLVIQKTIGSLFTKLSSIIICIFSFQIISSGILMYGYRTPKLSIQAFSLENRENPAPNLLIDASLKYSIDTCYKILQNKTSLVSMKNQAFFTFFEESGLVYMMDGYVPGGNLYDISDSKNLRKCFYLETVPLAEMKRTIFILPVNFRPSKEFQKVLDKKNVRLNELRSIGKFVLFKYSGPQIMEILAPQNLSRN